MYNEVIRKLLQKIEALPEKLVVLYLMKMHNLSQPMAVQALYAAYKSRVAYQKNGYLVRNPYVEINSALRNKAVAFRVLLEFLPESQEFICSMSPWILSFMKGNLYVQVCRIENGMELSTSMMIAGKSVPAADRAAIKRIAIVEPGCHLEQIKAVGISHFCTVDDDFKLEIIKKTDPKEAWNDVPEKA